MDVDGLCSANESDGSDGTSVLYNTHHRKKDVPLTCLLVVNVLPYFFLFILTLSIINAGTCMGITH